MGRAEGDRRRDAQQPDQLLLLPPRVEQGAVQFGEGRPGTETQGLAGLRQRDTARVADQQSGADLLFQPRYPAADDRLRGGEPLGGAAQPGRLGDGQEAFHVVIVGRHGSSDCLPYD